MKNNNKAFTLVELLGILAILSIIALIIVPSVETVIKNGKQKAYEVQRDAILTSVDDWLSENKKIIDLKEGQEIIITIGDLKSEGYLDYDFKNPLTGKCFSNANEVIITLIDGKYKVIINGKLQDGEDKECKTDTALPSIYLIGKNPVKINQGQAYVEPGYTAKSTLGKDITNRVQVTGTVDSTKISKTTIKYTVTEGGLTKTKTRNVEVLDTEKPKIYGANTTVLNSNVKSFDAMKDVYATDNSKEEIKIKTVGTVTLGVYGTYYIDYIATDSSGNTTNKRRRVIIADETPAYCFEFDPANGTITDYFKDFKEECNKNIRIPQIIDGVFVENIGKYAFTDTNINSVILPPSLKTVGGGGFQNSGLTQVDFSLATDLELISWYGFAMNNIESLDFSGNQKLHTIDIAAFFNNSLEGTLDLSSAKNLRTISHFNFKDGSYVGAFESNQITNLLLPSSLEEIGYKAFKYNNINQINFEKLNNLKIIDYEAFEYNSFKTLTIENLESLSKIGIASFEDNQLKKLVIKNNPKLEILGDSLWSNDGAFESNVMTELVIENNPNLKIIGQGAFWNNQLKSVDLSNTNIEKIGDYAFSTNLITDYKLPNTLTYMGSAAFNNNQLPDSLAFIKQVGEPDNIRSYGGAKRTNVIIPSDTKTIGDISFEGNSITSVDFSQANSLYDIELHAFKDNNIKSVRLENLPLLKYIRQGAFENNPNLKDVVIKNLPKLKYIGDIEAFEGSKQCGAFDSVGITNLTLEGLPSLTTIGDNAFAWNNIQGTLDLSGTILERIGESAFIGSDINNFILPTTQISHIGSSVFNGNLLTGTKAFIYYPNTTKLVSYGGTTSSDPVIPSNVTEIGNFAFYQTYIKNIDLSKATNLYKIGESAFEQTHLQSVVIPANIITIDKNAFKSSPLVDVEIQGNITRFNDKWANIGFPISQIPIITNLATINTSQPNDFSYNGNYGYEVTIPTTGKYKIEAWGAQGGYKHSSNNGGKGGYTSGEINLTAGEKIYIFVGSEGNNYGYNGGGHRMNVTTSFGGGASDVRIGGTSLYRRVIVAAGGGSEGGKYNKGGYAGGLSGNSRNDGGVGDGMDAYSGKGGTQTEGGAGSFSTTYYRYLKGQFGIGGIGYYHYSNNFGGAGGGGWFGGSGTCPDYDSEDDRGGGGGSSFIFTSSTTKISGYLLENKYQMTNTLIKGGNETMPTPALGTQTGNSGNGKVRIQFIS